MPVYEAVFLEGNRIHVGEAPVKTRYGIKGLACASLLCFPRFGIRLLFRSSVEFHLESGGAVALPVLHRGGGGKIHTWPEQAREMVIT